jgi:outer membrane protein assembly factor BamE (lipoprotein component of BamABCDE complex)
VKKLLLLLVLLYGSVASADAIDMRDYIKLRKGMSEAEVLYRLGAPDHEIAKSDHHHNILRKTWFFIPPQKSTGKWITEIEFDSNGRIINLERNRVK